MDFDMNIYLLLFYFTTVATAEKTFNKETLRNAIKIEKTQDPNNIYTINL